MSKEFNLIIVDDDNLVCQALNLIVNASDNINVIATGNNGYDAVNLYRTHKPDVILMDIRMGDFTGLDAADEILKNDKDAKILFLTTFADEEYIARALR